MARSGGRGRGSHAHAGRFGGTRKGTAATTLAAGRGNKGGTAAKVLATGSGSGRKISVGGNAVVASKGKK